MRELTPAQMVKALGMLASDKEWRKELRRAYREVGKVGANLARAEMRGSGDRQLAAAAKAVRGASNATSARVAVSRKVMTSKGPSNMGLAVTWGTLQRTGWFGKPKYADSESRNNPKWVGNTWRAAVKGEGPRGINDALADGIPAIEAKFEEVANDLLDRAFR